MPLKNSQYRAVMRSYEQKQLQDRDLLSRRREEVYEKLPEFRKLDDSISALSVQHARMLLSGDDHALDSLKEEIKSLRKKKAELLASAGFPPDYLEPVYHCPDCKDTGYIDGKKCHCFKETASRLLYEQSNLKGILEMENFAHFRLDYYSDNFIDQRTGRTSRQIMEDALASCRRFVAEFADTHPNLFLYGSVGIGKTFLSNCIAGELIGQGFSVLYYSAPSLFSAMAQNAFDRNSEEAASEREQIFDCDLLIIDDLGTEYTNAFVASQFFTCINERLMSQRSTVISTNLSLESLSDLYTERSFSRITSSYTMLKLIGDDIRIKKKLMYMEDK